MPGGRIGQFRSEWRGQGAAGGMARAREVLKVGPEADVAGRNLGRLQRVESGVAAAVSAGRFKVQQLWSSPFTSTQSPNSKLELPLFPAAILGLANFFEGVADRMRDALAMAAPSVADAWQASTQMAMAMAGGSGGSSELPQVMMMAGPGGGGTVRQIDLQRLHEDLTSADASTANKADVTYRSLIPLLSDDAIAAEAVWLRDQWESLDPGKPATLLVLFAYQELIPRLDDPAEAAISLPSIKSLFEPLGEDPSAAVSTYVLRAARLGSAGAALLDEIGRSEPSDIRYLAVVTFENTSHPFHPWRREDAPMVKEWLHKMRSDSDFDIAQQAQDILDKWPPTDSFPASPPVSEEQSEAMRQYRAALDSAMIAAQSGDPIEDYISDIHKYAELAGIEPDLGVIQAARQKFHDERYSMAIFNARVLLLNGSPVGDIRRKLVSALEHVWRDGAAAKYAEIAAIASVAALRPR